MSCKYSSSSTSCQNQARHHCLDTGRAADAGNSNIMIHSITLVKIIHYYKPIMIDHDMNIRSGSSSSSNSSSTSSSKTRYARGKRRRCRRRGSGGEGEGGGRWQAGVESGRESEGVLGWRGAVVLWNCREDAGRSRRTSAAGEQMLTYAGVCWQTLTYAGVC